MRRVAVARLGADAVVFAFIALAWLVAGGTAWAGCPLSTELPSIDIRVDSPPVLYNFTERSETLAKIASEYGTPDFGSGRVPFGLTVNQYDAPQIALDTVALSVPGGTCVYLKAVHVLLGLKRLEILIDRAFPVGTCEHMAILDHEEQHVRVAREAMGRYRAQIAAALRAAPLPVAVFTVAAGDPREAFLGPLRKVIDPVAAAIQRRINDGNARLDSPASYDETFRRCDNWGAGR